MYEVPFKCEECGTSIIVEIYTDDKEFEIFAKCAKCEQDMIPVKE
jgi:transcription elongation factor Elf1